jgi:sec-independent protein translocase protein TatA
LEFIMGGLFHPGGMQILLLLVVILLIFGASRLPALAKGIGQSARVFKDEMTQMQSEAAPQQTSAESTSVTPPPAKPDTTQQ